MFTKENFNLGKRIVFIQGSFNVLPNLSIEELDKRIISFFRRNRYYQLESKKDLIFQNYSESAAAFSPLRFEERIRINILDGELFYEVSLNQLANNWDKKYFLEVMSTLQRSINTGNTLMIDQSKYDAHSSKIHPVMKTTLILTVLLILSAYLLTVFLEVNPFVILIIWLVAIGILIYRFNYAMRATRTVKASE